MSARSAVLLVYLACLTGLTDADDLLYRYEGDVLPYDESAGWLWGGCVDPCTESAENGHLKLTWTGGEIVNYTYLISNDAGEPPLPETLWVEWRFRSNQRFTGVFHACDGSFVVRYKLLFDLIEMFGDAVISFSGDDVLAGLNIDEFKTYRFESLDGQTYQFSVDGQVFIDAGDFKNEGGAYLQMVGLGGCEVDQLPTINEWDFVRYGTISYGEQIVASDPPNGFVDTRTHAVLDRFTVTYDSPNYVYLDEISIVVSGGDAPEVIQTRRRENNGPESVEIVLDRPIPMGETTRFTLDDGGAVNVIEYTFAPADTDGDGDADLHDLAALQKCFAQAPPTGACLALDLVADGLIDLADHAQFESHFAGP